MTPYSRYAFTDVSEQATYCPILKGRGVSQPSNHEENKYQPERHGVTSKKTVLSSSCICDTAVLKYVPV
jgi:hypothetical protein